MSHSASLLVTEAVRSLEALADVHCATEHQREKYHRHLERLRVAIDQFSRLEVLMSAIAEAIRFERARAEKAEQANADLKAGAAAAAANAQAKIDDLTSQLANAARPLDADDLAELEKVKAELAVSHLPPDEPA